MLKQIFFWMGLITGMVSCSDKPVNSPYPLSDDSAKILYASFDERPKHLDPARSYSSNESTFISQIYEPPLQYNFIKRPYQLEPLTLEKMPTVNYVYQWDKVAFSIYTLNIKPGIYYQPHPAFARKDGKYIYYPAHKNQLGQMFDSIRPEYTRRLDAYDYAYQIKRLADPDNHSPVFGHLSKYIAGFKKLREKIKSASKNGWHDLRPYQFDGVKVLDRNTLQIKIRGKYPQFLYWLAMNFFAPMPWEADRFYSQKILDELNINFDWYPVGTGPFMLTVNDPNSKMVLEKNPNFHGEIYPGNNREQLPFIDKVVFSLEKETIPRWNKFLQGYYDSSGISSDSFDRAVSFSETGVELASDLKDKGIRLVTEVEPSTFYMGFNMADPVVGGLSNSRQKLRQAISIALDFEEYISIFANGRGIAAQSPLPPGIFGKIDGKEGINPVVYNWINGKVKRKSISAAKKLLADAGYPNGIDRRTGKPLVLYFDTVATGPDDNARLSWYRKQFAKLNIQLVIRNTDYNRFQEKMRKGKAQIFMWGWHADYPDPENFLFLLYGPNAKIDKNGENAANYKNPEYDKLFEQMRNMENSPERLAIIRKMITVLHQDAPWIFGLHPKRFSLYHGWYEARKPNLMANNTIKYIKIYPKIRRERQNSWNRPLLWPVISLTAVMILLCIPIVLSYRAKEYEKFN